MREIRTIVSSSQRFEGDFAKPTDIELAVDDMLAGRALTVNNDATGAICGNADSSFFTAQVESIKGRDARSPYGLTVDPGYFLSLLDLKLINRMARPLFEDLDRFIGRFGATCFVRAPANQDRLIDEDVPGAVISLNENSGKPYVQNWTSEGKDNYTELRRTAEKRGIKHFGITSLNLTGEKEITDPTEIANFARDHGMSLLRDSQAATNGRGQRRLSGSFPIVIADEKGLTLARNKWPGGVLLMKRLLAGYDLRIKPVDDGLGDTLKLDNLEGPELRYALLQRLGWMAVTGDGTNDHKIAANPK